jgi:peptidoglycan/xylan/chitin deacetylase (PgdA/CDA1 family)
MPLPADSFVGLTADQYAGVEVLRNYAEFWKIPNELVDDTASLDVDTIFSSGRPRRAFDGKTVVISPSGVEDATRIAQDYGLTVTTGTSMISLPMSEEALVSIQTQTYDFQGSGIEPVIASKGYTVLSKIRDRDTYILSIDLVSACNQLLRGLDDNPHPRFRFITKLRGSYNLIPKFVRNRAFRDPEGLEKLREEKIAPMECLRLIFLASILKASGRAIPFVGFWKRGKDYALAITHDVETREGLENGSWRLYEIEQKLHVRSTWNVPSDRYPLSNDILSKLAVGGELGAHDTRHDGRLVLADFEAKVKRVTECRMTLEQRSGKEVRGFRSPLLQHSRELVEALGKAGYTHDSSIPSWEILSPTSLGPHGIGTVFPFIASGIVEIPVSLPQDHQLLRVVGLKPNESVELMHKLSGWIGSLGGACLLLVHPDYEFGLPENQDEYRRLLENFTRDPRCDIMTLDEIATWWSLRNKVSWHVENGRMRLSGGREQIDPVDTEIQIKFATDYDDTMGLRTELIQ